MGRLQPFIDDQFANARSEDRREAREGYAFDTLLGAQTKATRADDADRFCHHHHDLKTRLGYRLEPGTGKRQLLPPERAPAAIAS